MIAGGYYPDWVEDVMPPEAVNYKLFDLINYCASRPLSPSFTFPADSGPRRRTLAAFALPTSDDNIEISSYSAGLLQRVVKLAHAANTKVVIAIGGWSDSNYFSGAVSTSSRRKTFVNNIVAFVNKYNLDGVDIDWCVVLFLEYASHERTRLTGCWSRREYPGTQGAGGNEVSASDTANLLSFLKLLRASLPDKRLSTCTTQQTYIGANGSPIGDVSAYAQYLDAILVMNYDVWGGELNFRMPPLRAWKLTKLLLSLSQPRRLPARTRRSRTRAAAASSRRPTCSRRSRHGRRPACPRPRS
jgi:chitinase